MPAPRKPPELKIISGSRKPDRPDLRPPPDRVLTHLPPPPDFLTTPDQREAWQKAGNLLLANGELEELKLQQLALYAALAGKCALQIRAGLTPTPSTFRELRGLMHDLGLTRSTSPLAAPTSSTTGGRWADIRRRAELPDLPDAPP